MKTLCVPESDPWCTEQQQPMSKDNSLENSVTRISSDVPVLNKIESQSHPQSAPTKRRKQSTCLLPVVPANQPLHTNHAVLGHVNPSIAPHHCVHQINPTLDVGANVLSLPSTSICQVQQPNMYYANFACHQQLYPQLMPPNMNNYPPSYLVNPNQQQTLLRNDRQHLSLYAQQQSAPVLMSNVYHGSQTAQFIHQSAAHMPTPCTTHQNELFAMRDDNSGNIAFASKTPQHDK